MLVTSIMRCYGSTSCRGAENCHLFKRFTFDLDTLSHERQEQVLAQVPGRFDLQISVQEFAEALQVDFLKQRKPLLKFRNLILFDNNSNVR